MSHALKSYMVKLASDVERLAAFIADPQRAAEEAGLNEKEREILFSKDPQRLYAAVAHPERDPDDQKQASPQIHGKPAGTGTQIWCYQPLPVKQQATPIVTVNYQEPVAAQMHSSPPIPVPISPTWWHQGPAAVPMIYGQPMAEAGPWPVHPVHPTYGQPVHGQPTHAQPVPVIGPWPIYPRW
ncbi:MAG TPA: hypothetical protein VKZ53_03935 [Candidatus Angelobacter sp.]|nr:hypothetical protein [Candidatus Angelobacter sp.]